MLTRSLCCFKGVSAEAEQRLWRRGCLSWRHLKMTAPRHFSIKKRADLMARMPFYEAALEARSADFFIGNLPCGHKLRILPEFQENAAFLDIETTGLERASLITVIGLWHHGTLEPFVRGRNLPDFIKAWQNTDVLITFNGTHFDLPFLMREFGFTGHPPHIDLMAEAKHWGLTGGLKAIEQKLGYRRTAEESGDGHEAVTLWNTYAETGNEHALKKLLAYNTRDVLSLRLLSRHLWRLSCQNYDAPHPLF